MYIYFDEDNLPDEQTSATMYKAAELCLQAEDIESDNISLSVTFVDKEEIRRLNREFRGVDSVTDVLSFPQYDGGEELEDFEELTLGDVVICLDKCREQAIEVGHSFEREEIYLFVHSVLHLLGYDHMEEEDKKLMRAAEERVMTQLGITRDE